MGRDQRRRRRRGSLPRAPRRRRHARGVPRRAGADHGHPGNDRRQGRARRCTLDVRVTRHGPLISDAINANNAAARRRGRSRRPLEPLAFRWTALDADDTTLAAFLKLNEARNWTEFTDGAARLRRAVAELRLRRRRRPHRLLRARAHPDARAGDGSLPAEGWTGDAEWTGWIPFDELPHAFDPPEHFIVTANNRPAPADVSVRPRRSSGPSRIARSGIVDLPARRNDRSFTPDDFARDPGRHAVAAREGAAAAAARARASATTRADRQALELLRAVELRRARRQRGGRRSSRRGSMQLAPAHRRRRARRRSSRRTTQGNASRSSRASSSTTLAANDGPWCDDVRTPAQETCDDAVTTALHDGVARSDAAARRRHGALALGRRASRGVPAPGARRGARCCGRCLSRSVPHGGDWSTVNVGACRADHPFEQHSVPGYRADHRSLAGQRQPLPRRGRRVGPSAVAALRRFPRATGAR